jgi:hypothetical protein
MYTFFVAVKTKSELNNREHWRHTQRRAKSQRHAAMVETMAAMRATGVEPEFPAIVHMVRVGIRRLDGDNLQGSLKHVRDGIADALGVDDGDESRVLWEYEQKTGKVVGVTVSIVAQRVWREALAAVGT